MLLDAERGIYYGLNEVAAAAFERLADGTPLESVEAELAAQFDVRLDTLRADLQFLVGEFLRLGLVQRV